MYLDGSTVTVSGASFTACTASATLGDDAYILTSDTYALNISTNADATDAPPPTALVGRVGILVLPSIPLTNRLVAVQDTRPDVW